jgi:hypothetical protein
MRKSTCDPVQAGRSFGSWTVIVRAEGAGKRRWLCECACGSRRSVREDALRSGSSTSCGCSRAPIRAGDQIGRLTVLHPATPAPDGRPRWACRCSCGNVCDVRAGCLSSGDTSSCGCYGRETSARKGIDRTELATYRTVHKRLDARRGPASNHSCIDCGRPGQEWSYNESDPNEMVERVGRFAMRYSTDLAQYDPRCIPCHRRRDGVAGF